MVLESTVKKNLVACDGDLILLMDNLDIHSSKPNYLRMFHTIKKARDVYFKYISYLIKENNTLQDLLSASKKNEKQQCSHIYECSEATVPRVRNYSYKC